MTRQGTIIGEVGKKPHEARRVQIFWPMTEVREIRLRRRNRNLARPHRGPTCRSQMVRPARRRGLSADRGDRYSSCCSARELPRNPIAEIEHALKAGEFVPYYQPIVDIRSGRLRGAEVLVRWRKPDGTLVLPGAFIPLAESSGLILDLDREPDAAGLRRSGPVDRPSAGPEDRVQFRRQAVQRRRSSRTCARFSRTRRSSCRRSCLR